MVLAVLSKSVLLFFMASFSLQDEARGHRSASVPVLLGRHGLVVAGGGAPRRALLARDLGYPQPLGKDAR